MKKILLLLLVTLACISSSVNAQTTATYNFAASSGTYTTLTTAGGATSISGLTGDDLTVCSIPIGFGFNYCGTTYTSICVCTNGWASLGSTSSNVWGNASTAIPSAGFLMPFWDDLMGTSSTHLYQTTGTTPNRVFTVEWKNATVFPSASCPCASFQIKLYEGTNCVEFCYGSSTFSANSATIGISNSTTDWRVLPNSGTSPTPSGVTFTTTIASSPANGQIYRWCPCPVSVTATNNGPTCAGGSIIISGTTSGTSYTWAGPGGYSSSSLSNTLSPITSTQAGVYTLTASNGTCTMAATTMVNVVPTPTITVAPATTPTICLGASTTFTVSGSSSPSSTIVSQNWNTGMTGAVGGTWSIVNLAGNATSYFQIRNSPGYASAVSGCGTPYMECAPDATGSGVLTHTMFVSPTFSTIGYSSVSVSYNHYYQYWYQDIDIVVEYSIDGGTTWATPPLVNYFSAGTSAGSGTWSCTGAMVTHALPAATMCQPNVKLRWRYNGVWGYWWAVDDIVISGTPMASTYVWSGGTGLTCTTCNPNTITPTVTGLNTYSLTSTVCGCSVPTTVAVYVNSLTTPIIGTPITCIGTTTTLSNGTSGGSWSSSDPTVATVGATSGVVTGVAAGTSMVDYCMPGGCCAQVVVTVYPTPGAITGSTSVCVGNNTTLGNSVTGGTWTSSNTSIAPIDATTGVVTGMSVGSAVITYSFGASCYTLTTVNVYAPPTSITGSLITCVGTGTSLSGSPGGGLWSITAPSSGTPLSSIATVGITSGYVTGIGAGTVTVSYRIGICAITRVFTVVPGAGVISPTPSGTYSVCPGNVLPLSSTVSGGVWTSSNTSVATVGASTGLVAGVTAGTTIITYSVGGGACYTTTTITVTPAPPPITGDSTVCVGSMISLSHITAGGTWTSSNTSVATISSSGVVTGVAPVTTLISYTVPAGCIVTKTVTVYTTPTPPTGSWSICQGTTTTLASTPSGGTWSSSNTAVAGVDATTGVMTGVAGGTSTIAYSVGGCSTTFVATVNPTPTITGGTSPVCQGYTTSLAATPGGGTWTSSAPSTASVDPVTGVVSGVAGGTAIISYTSLAGCSNSIIVTVNATPVITGAANICVGLCSSLSTTTVGGTWSSSNPTVASISTSGLACGLALGTSTISYVSPIGCVGTVVVTVSSVPAITGLLQVCVGSTTPLGSTIPGGTWVSSVPATGTIDATTGVAGGIAAGLTTITYNSPSGCAVTGVLTVDPLPSPISGSLTVCSGATSLLSSTPSGGTWTVGTPSSGTPGSIATVGLTTGVVTGGATLGTATITYSTPATFCKAYAVVTVVAAPTAITSASGSFSVCVNSTLTLGSTPATGTWNVTPGSGNATISTGGVLTGTSAGTVTVSYAIGSGCAVTQVVTVFATPAAITGNLNVCVGGTTTLASSVGATWTSGTPSVAPIIGATGVATGVTAGTTLITAAFSSGCSSTAILTVNPIPPSITGVMNTCIGQTTTLANTLAGTWSSACATASVNSTTGVVTGISAGTCVITFTATTGCITASPITVNALPTTVAGPSSICIGIPVTMSSTPAGGSWSVSPSGFATIGSTTGEMIGTNVGVVTITYTVGSGCFITKTVTVNDVPSPITGPLTTCVGMCIGLGGSPAGGTWSVTPGTVATISSTGNLCGLVTGSPTGVTATVSYTLGTGCAATRVVTVNPLPGTIVGSGIACVGSNTPYSCTPAGGLWSITPTSIATVNATTGDVTGVSTGTATLTYTVGSGCFSTTTVTVHPSPAAIGGSLSICIGSCTTLTNATPGGTWLSGSSVATIGPSTGYVCGSFAGTTTITYMVSTGCTATGILTVNPLPTSIGGTLSVCQGFSTSLTGTPTGGTWSISPTTVATVNATTGVWYGVVTGATSPATATVTYTSAAGCSITAIVTVNPLPSAITGSHSIAIGGNTTLSGSPAGGTWSAPAPGTVTVYTPITAGVIHGNSLGRDTVIYTLPTGCFVTDTVNVVQQPSVSDTFVCLGYTVPFSTGVPGGSWSSSNPAVGSINAATGVAGGMGVGTVTITYMMPTGISATGTLTVLANPAAITGMDSVCVGLTTTLSSSTPGGVWSSSAPAVANISTSGVVSGLSAGTSIITYTAGNCFVTHIVTVNGLPAPISGSSAFCNFSSTTMSSSPAGGTWTVSPGTGAATIDPTTGVITGAAQGTVMITYTLPTGCLRTTQDSVIFAPPMSTGPTQVCMGDVITLSNTVTGGVWTSSNPSFVPVDPTTGVVTGMSTSTAIISYTISTGCTDTTVITVNPLPGVISGIPVICEASTTTLSNGTPGGTWVSGDTTVAVVDPATGIVTGMGGGTVTISYVLSTGCFSSTIMTINALPTPIAGSLSICIGNTSTLTSTPTGGNWWSSTSAVSIGFSSGIATGMAVGTSVISYTIASGCTRTAVATVYPMPAAIFGMSTVCEGSTTSLANSTSGGMWVSSNPAVGSIDPTGVVTGVMAGTMTITYQMPTGCSATKPMTVNATPTIGGSLQVCAGFNTNLIGIPGGGTWATQVGTSLIGTVNPMTGVVTGISGGNMGITYTLTSGCRVINIVTVNNLPPAIGGVAQVCVASTTTLTNGAAGGTWTSANTLLATVDPVTGVVTGVSNGTVDITYTIVTGCINTRQVTVNPLPAPIMGTPVLCGNAVTIFTDATAGGTWGSYDSTIATVAPVGTGIGSVSGIATGTTTISYKLFTTGCFVTKDVTVNTTPPAIGGSGHVCIGSTRLLTNTMSGGVWTSSNSMIAPVSSTGVVSGVMLGTAIIAYTLPGSGCAASKLVTVQPLPSEYSVTGGGSYCTGGSGVAVGLSGSQIGVSYALFYGASATGYLTGTNLPLNFGLMTLGGVYTVQATNPTTGCTRNMIGSATVVVTPPSVPAVSINSVPGDTVCPGTMTTVGPVPVNGGATPTYVWKVNGVVVSTAPAYSFIPADGDLVGVTMTSSSGCVLPNTASAEKVLHVAPSMMPTVSMTLDPGDTVCQYSLVTYMANPSYGGAAPTYTWMVNGAAMGSGPVFTYVPNDGDAINCRMISNYLCRLSDSAISGTVAMVVDSMIVPHIHITPHPGYAVDSGTLVKFTTVVTDAGTSPTFQWYINGVPVPGATADSFQTSTLHHYDSVVCRVTSSGICKDVSSYDWAFISVSPVGVQQIGIATDIRLVPNPNNGTFTIKGTWGTIDEQVNVEVTNMLGQVVFSGKVDVKNGKVNEQVQLNSTLANGMYMFNMRTATESKVFHFVMEQ